MIENRNAYLFIWNEAYYHVGNIIDLINKVDISGTALDDWSTSGHKKVNIGDRAFITRAGKTANKGIFASGIIVEKGVKVWKESSQKFVPGVRIEFDTVLNPSEQLLNIEIIKSNTPVKQKWPPQSSGTQIKKENDGKLEILWRDFLGEIIKPELTILEGTPYQLNLTAYERDRNARMICLQMHGYSCIVCNFNFKNVYGDIGNEFIHVHHLNQLSDAKEQHTTNPINDLCPVCPNCHAMLHRRKQPYSIQELKDIIKKSKALM